MKDSVQERNVYYEKDRMDSFLGREPNRQTVGG